MSIAEITFAQRLEQLSTLRQPIKIMVPRTGFFSLTSVFGTHRDAGYLEVKKNKKHGHYQVEYTDCGYMQTRMSSNDWRRADFKSDGSRALSDLLPALWSGAAFQAGIPVSAAPGKFRDQTFEEVERHINRAYAHHFGEIPTTSAEAIPSGTEGL